MGEAGVRGRGRALIRRYGPCMTPLLLFLAMALAETPNYAGRPIAPVMTWHGADWLERPERANEESTERMLRQLKLSSGDDVADLGCGTGFHARRMKQQVGDGGVVYCIDLQPEMVDRARRLAAAEGVELELLVGEVARIPLPDDSVDQVLMVDVYHELSDPDAMHAELHRVLRPGGVLTLVEFRLEGRSAEHILREHRMADEQVQAELTAAGFVEAHRYDKLPNQHLLRFRSP